MTTLARLSRVELRDIWKSEATDFTPWLAREENLEVLSATLVLDLELEAQEKQVGPFRADLLCKDIGSDTWVLIENQLERTDHKHLGQVMTYASGLNAATIVWIAREFTDEHRSTLDWLNRITEERFRFFGLEVELWRIADSPAAPKFNVVSKPNDWSKAVSRAAARIHDGELSELQRLQFDYWTELNREIVNQRGPVSGARSVHPQSWSDYPIGRTTIKLSAYMIRTKSAVRADLYFTGRFAKARFQKLSKDRDAIMRETDLELEWEELAENSDCRIGVHLGGVDVKERTDWPRQHRWLAKSLNSLDSLFRTRVKRLSVDDDPEESDT